VRGEERRIASEQVEQRPRQREARQGKEVTSVPSQAAENIRRNIMPPMRATAGAFLILAIAAPAASAASLTDGKARFEVITPSLIRLQYAADGKFENGRTQTTEGRLRSSGSFRTTVRGGRRIIRTSRMALRWRRGSGSFSASNLTVVVGRRALHPSPGPNPSPLGGWRRSLDLVDGPRPLHEGVLSREGWYVLDDSKTPLVSGDSFTPRAHEGDYQDLYLFAYGHDYARALRDLRVLTGAAPLLPRKAFGVWFSRYWPYSAADWKPLVERFRSERVPLDTISLDTDYKQVHDPGGAALASQIAGAPGGNYSWNGWDWNRTLYPDPAGFFAWARGNGLNVALNVHPSIDTTDPQFEATQARAGGGLKADDGCRVVQADPNGQCMVFDWTVAKQRDAYFALHDRFEKDGASFWWLDWCCDASSADAPGLTPDTWINKLYFERQRARGSRWPAFQRIGGSFQLGFEGATGNGAFAEHRYTLQFTGDTCGTWPLLAFASEFTAAEASIGLLYVSHDIGTFHAVSPTGVCDKTISPILTPRENSLPDDMYVRWVQLGTFQPLLRLHSHHGKRLPWEYPGKPGAIAANFLRLREALVPYLYSLAAAARSTGVPPVRPLYLQWPRQSEAYEHPSQYMLGRDVLIAPVSEPGDPAEPEVWFPPGTWVDWFTGEQHRGGAIEKLAVPLDRMPVFVRAGGIVPMQPELPTTDVASPRKLILTVTRGAGRTTLYDDAGDGLGYLQHRYARTGIRQTRRKLLIGAMKGDYPGRPARRSWEVRIIGRKPRVIRLGPRSTRRPAEVRLG
jgi:alpha-glucosidase (family GH31 glycosyl hydrolase)